MQSFLILPLLLSASAAIFAESTRPRRAAWVYLFKPLTTILVITLAAALPAPDPAYRLWILVGLALSLVGDILLMLPRDRFVPGLAAFLLAHLAYLGAFTRHIPLGAASAPFLVVGALAAAMLPILWPGIPRRTRLPVLAYVAVLAAMAGQAMAQGLTLSQPSAWAGAAGGGLFFFSDSALAYDRFRRPYRWARAVVLSSYWTAQTLIALSVEIIV